MGDVLRQLLYPLAVPAIVACVWAHAWAMKQEPAHREIPPEAAAAATALDLRQPASPPGGHYGFAAEDGLASVDDE